jgi:hypothetical protein
MIPCLAFMLFGCATFNGKRAPVGEAIPIKTVSSGGGMIESAELSVHGDRVYVWGFVRRQSVIDPPMWARVDVSVLDPAGNTTESITVNYIPREIPHGQRGQPAHSMFTAKLTKVPAPRSTVLVAFNSERKFSERGGNQFCDAKE